MNNSIFHDSEQPHRCQDGTTPDQPDESVDVLVLTVLEASRLLRISRGAAYEAVRRGQIPSVRIGRRLLIPVQALQALLNTDGAVKRDDP